VDRSVDRIQAGLSVVAQSVNQVRSHERMLQAAGVRLDRAGASLLYKLHLSEGTALRVTALAERLGVDTPTVTRKVQQLERLGLVAREADAEDRRAIRIRLTDEGRTVLARLMAARREWLEHLLAGWPAADKTTFATLLGRFTDRLQVELDGVRVD
jgi:DNA-binding MarR family transcriptional regulator